MEYIMFFPFRRNNKCWLHGVKNLLILMSAIYIYIYIDTHFVICKKIALIKSFYKHILCVCVGFSLYMVWPCWRNFWFSLHSRNTRNQTHNIESHEYLLQGCCSPCCSSYKHLSFCFSFVQTDIFLQQKK